MLLVRDLALIAALVGGVSACAGGHGGKSPVDQRVPDERDPSLFSLVIAQEPAESGLFIRYTLKNVSSGKSLWVSNRFDSVIDDVKLHVSDTTGNEVKVWCEARRRPAVDADYILLGPGDTISRVRYEVCVWDAVQGRDATIYAEYSYSVDKFTPPTPEARFAGTVRSNSIIIHPGPEPSPSP